MNDDIVRKRPCAGRSWLGQPSRTGGTTSSAGAGRRSRLALLMLALALPAAVAGEARADMTFGYTGSLQSFDVPTTGI
jgi:hypothetical protein